MEKCWDKDSLKRPNSSEIKSIIDNWISNLTNEDNIIKKESKNVIVEFYKAEKVLEGKQTSISNISNKKSHSHAYHTSRLLDFTKKLNEILDQEDVEIYNYKNDKLHNLEISQSIGKYYDKVFIIRNFKTKIFFNNL